ncbi:2-dehydropantoate 2-reductase [Pseudoalteromonas citrea]|uniref:2-dehydropantoate 2-reductase n=2 Tax=Pseudoalteromonas citrea TaxID=43655 RepID=A0AAD4AGN3_9GAMM|nr:2-dehydropantoate 2-reductase [Pseudoalteromonas citrea]KAF7768748.1 2-dehydropantoate 2-reductase [Pseudoalteromonas citrea]
MANLHIVGAGAIGLSLANALAYHHHTTLLVRRGYNTPFSFYNGQKTHSIPVKHINMNALQKDILAIQNCFICVKAYQLQSAFKSVLPYLTAHANVFISHNGMSELNEFEQHLGADQGLFFVSTSMGGLKINDTTVQETGAGETYVGACNKVALERLAHNYSTFFSSHIPHSKTHHNIEQLRWQKLLVNVAINPLSAIHQIKNGQLRQPKYASTILQLLNEACAVARADKVHLELSEALANAYQVMTLTQNNSSSMAQDVFHNRETEIDAICGYITRRGVHHGIHTPYNRSMLEQLLKSHS